MRLFTIKLWHRVVRTAASYGRDLDSNLGLNINCTSQEAHYVSAQQVNAIYRFVTMVYYYNYHSSGHYPSSCLLFRTQFNSIGLSVPHRKHITSSLRAQQVNAIYRFVTMVY
jgi:hypothetical protein